MTHTVPDLLDPKFADLSLESRFVATWLYYSDVVKVRERPAHDNRGPEIDVWSKYLGYQTGLAWCGICATTMLRFSGYDGALPPGPAGTWNWSTWANAKGYAKAKGQRLQRGDVWVIKRPDGTGHMGAGIADYDEDPNTGEGNTNDDGSREGYEMAKRHRLLVASDTVTLIRLPGFDVRESKPLSMVIGAIVQKTAIPARLIEDDAQPLALIGVRALHDAKLLRLIEVTPGIAKVVFNGQAKPTALPLYVIDGRGYVPAKLIAAGMGRGLAWDNAAKRVTIQ